MGTNFLSRCLGLESVIGQPFERLDELNEQFGVNENCKSKLYVQVRTTLDFIMKFSSIELTEDDPKSTPEQLYQSKNQIHAKLSPERPPLLFVTCKLGPQIWSFICSKFVILFNVSTLTFLSLEILYIARLMYERDKMIKDQSFNADFGSRRTEKCAFKDDIDHDGRRGSDQYRTLEELNEALTFFGSFMNNLPGVGLMMFGIVGMAPIVFYYLGVITMLFKRFRVDHLAFLIDPVYERNRIRLQLDKLVEHLIDSLTVRRSSLAHLPSSMEAIKGNQSGVFEELEISRSNHLHSKFETKTKRIENLHFVQLLIEIYNSDQVKPANLTSKWHLRFLEITKPWIVFCILTSYLGTMANIMGIVFIDISLDTQMRLEALECKRLRANGTVLVEALKPVGLVQSWQVEAYNSFDGSLSSFLYLMLYIETRYYFKPRVLLLLFQYHLMIVFISIWSTFYVSLFVLGFVHKYVWVEQISQQVRVCVRLLTQLGEFKDREANSSGKSLHELETERTQLASLLTISYLNHELFRRSNFAHQHLARLLLAQIATLAASSFAFAYLVATNASSGYRSPVLYSSLAIVSTLDIYLFASSFLVKQVEKLMRDLSRLQAHGISNSLGQLKHPLELWRRQQLSDKETRKFFAASFLGTPVSYEKTLSINTYLFAIWLILLRVN